MKENMVYNPMYYQLREPVLRRMLAIIEGNKRCQKGGIVFVGDSLMQHYQAPHYLKTSRPIYNCGISGYTSKEMLMILDEAVLKYEPSLVFLHVGTNDLGDTLMRSPREIAWWLYQIAEATGHFAMFNYMLDTIEQPLSQELIKQFHFKLKNGVFEDLLNGFPVGEYKNRKNTVDQITTASPNEVEEKVAELVTCSLHLLH